MATIGEIHVKVTGIGKSRFGLWLLGFVARVFQIQLKVQCTTDSEEAFEELDQTARDAGFHEVELPKIKDGSVGEYESTI